MDTTQQIQPKNNRTLIVCMIAIIFLLCGLIVLLLFYRGREDSAQSVMSDGSGAPKLTYASSGVTIIDDADALQKAVDEMYARAAEGSMTLQYKNGLYSNDGLVFDCALGNSNANSYDMFITISADDAFTEQLFLSGLLRPGEQFESITLERALEPGTHTLYIAFTQVEKDLETIHSQIIISTEAVVTTADS